MTQAEPDPTSDSVDRRLSTLQTATDGVTPSCDFVGRVLLATQVETYSTWTALSVAGRRALVPLVLTVLVLSAWADRTQDAAVGTYLITASPLEWEAGW